ncbi:helix-turn-helix domain-containing protein [Kitasatospora aureofaciens]|uniref:helix-turn-helix domain-containing protein n=1 Tax=Kitasatospora aureofaciens TaxID=1894 RepID=UPI00210E3483|nr:helix-turn-helix transcriptional regulator [Kitasatospora aureofaciens]
MISVQRWSGREAALLREAMRMTLRDFADYLGVSDRAVSKWVAGGAALIPRQESQAILDTALERCSDEVRARFAEALGQRSSPRSALAPIVVDSHKFIPVYIGEDRARHLRGSMTEAPGAWLERSSAEIHRSDGACTLHVFACGVAVFHLVQSREPASLTDLALWRYRTYAADLPWARGALADALDVPVAQAPNPEYVLSMYWLVSSPWRDEQLETAARLLSTPSVLVNRTSAVPQPLDASVEDMLLDQGFEHPDLVSFGIRGVSTGYAGWSGVAYTAQDAERSLTLDELVTCELNVQALWAFCRQIQQLVEDGQDPAISEGYGWRFLRAAYSRLTTARAQETAQHVLMREAVVNTSGLADRMRAAQDALRDTVG